MRVPACGVPIASLPVVPITSTLVLTMPRSCWHAALPYLQRMLTSIRFMYEDHTPHPMHGRGLCVSQFSSITILSHSFRQVSQMEIRGESRDRLHSADIYVIHPSMRDATSGLTLVVRASTETGGTLKFKLKSFPW